MLSTSRVYTFLCILAVFSFLLVNSSYGAGLKIGLFPVRQSVSLGNSKLPDKLLPDLTQILKKELEKAQIGEIVMLAWPDQLGSSDQPTFETLVNCGKEQGCNGVIALQLSSRSFTMKDTNVPLIGKVSSAEAVFGITGGLIDVAASAAVSPVKAESKKKEQPYRGSNPSVALKISFGNKDFDDSLLGKAANESIQQVVSAVKGGVSKLTSGSISVSSRANAPAGIGFGQDKFSMDMTTGYDIRGTVSVVNRGTKPQTFIIVPKNTPEGFVVGLMGDGSVDGPCTLDPGQWKDIRLVANAPEYVDVQSVDLMLYAVESGKTPSVGGTPTDTATMNLQWKKSAATIDFVIVGQDPVTLAYTCKLQNKTSRDILGLSVGAHYGETDLVQITPNLKKARIPANGSITFYVIPRMFVGMRTMDVTLECVLNGNLQSKWPLHFEVPKGKSVYLGMGHTSESSSSGACACVNQGGMDFDAGDENGMSFDMTDRSPNYKFTLWLGNTWWWIVEHINTKEQLEEMQRPRESLPDVRGATIRPNVAVLLAKMDTDSITHPMASKAKDFRGFVYYSTPADGKTQVFFVRETPAINMKPRLDVMQLSENGHNARWPYIRSRWSTSQAYVVWEDSMQGKGSDLAFRSSGKSMQDWSSVKYLTSHGKGVDDPVVHVDDKGSVVVAWNDFRDGKGQVYVRISRDGGKTFGPEVSVARVQGESHAWPQIDFSSDGGFALVYVLKIGTQTQIISRRLDKDAKLNGEAFVLSNKNALCGEPQIACDPSGAVYSVWREGDGDASEVWFSSCPSGEQKWIAPKQMTNDKVYSEYPLVWITDKTLFASYHTDSDGVMDLKYVMTSNDGGDTWSERIAQPSLESDSAGRAFVEMNFSLQNPRSTYKPYTTTIFMNGVQIGKLENTIPEGTYVWEVPKGIARSRAQGMDNNHINFTVEGVNRAHYTLAANVRLIIQRRYTQLAVVASSQVEADELAKKGGVSLNHSAPDLALAANAIKNLPAKLNSGDSIELPLQVYNLGEAIANEVKVYVYAADPRDPMSDLKTLKLAEVQVGSINPGQMKPVSISFKYDPAHAPRVYAAVYSKEKDFQDLDNVWGYSFTKGESDLISPLFGTDIPNVLQAPDLVGMVSIPNIPGLLDLVSVPGLDKMLGIPGVRLPNVGQFTNPLSSIPKVRNIGVPNPVNIKMP